MLFPLLLALAMPARAAAVAPSPAAVPIVAARPATPAPVPDSVRPPHGGGEPRHALASSAEAGLGLEGLLRAEAAVADEVARGTLPGAALAIGRRGHIVVERGIGRTDWGAAAQQVDPDRTVYDLASLTKVVATTTALMLLVEDGEIDLHAPVARYLPEFSGGRKDEVTVWHLLTHTSGLPAWADLWGDPEQALARAVRTPLARAPGAHAEYSDVGFVVLWAAAQRAHGAEPLYRLLDRRVFGPLGMLATTFLPGSCGVCAPTARRSDGGDLRGRVHDPTALRLGGVAGNAGLFSTVHDVARFAAMLASGGELNGTRVLRAETIHAFAQRQPGCGTRALGWDTPSGRASGSAGVRISPRAFGHTGFTGTSLWVDPERGTWAVLLANRTYSSERSGPIQALRRTLNDWVAVAADRGAPRPAPGVEHVGEGEG